MFNHCATIEIPDLVKVTGEDGKRYYTTPDGDRFPSVTTVVGAASNKKEIIQAWRNRVGHEEANRITRISASRGTKVHSLCEDYLNNTLSKNVFPDSLEMFRSIKPFLNRINNIHFQEKPLWSKNLKLAGTVDCIAEFDGVLSVIDFKTSKRTKYLEDIEDYFWQTCAYALMYEELSGLVINQLVVIMAVENDPPLLFVQKTEDYIEGLVGAIREYNRQNNELQRPY
jgi:PD-(D/E)XK nuclease superfamily